MAKRVCKVDPKETKSGKPCKATPLKAGTEIEGVKVTGDFCRGHDPDIPDNARFGSRAQAKAAGEQGGRPAKPRVVDILKEKFEDRAEEFLKVLDEALQAQEPYTVGWGEDAYLEMVPDHKTRLKALEMAFNRVYGKPKQATEISGPNGGPIEADVVSIPSEADFQQGVAQILAAAGAAGNEQ